MPKGRPKLPEGERLVHASIRLPAWMYDECKREGGVSLCVRRALERYFYRE